MPTRQNDYHERRNQTHAQVRAWVPKEALPKLDAYRKQHGLSRAALATELLLEAIGFKPNN